MLLFYLALFFSDLAFAEPALRETIIVHIFTVKPWFAEKKLSYTVVEGQSLNVSLNATGNPPQIEFKWNLPPKTSGTSNRIHVEGPQMIITKAKRSDRGNYTVLAWNGHGNFNTTVVIFIDVQYAPR